MPNHNNFHEPAAFLQAGGQKSIPIPVLRAGNYAINPWFASVEKVPMIRVGIGSCGVVPSYVGPEGADLTDDNVNARIVSNGCKGIWADPLQPGKHPLNTKILKVDIVPTTQILLNLADGRSSAHALDSKDTLIADVVLPAELTKTVTDRQIAEQERKTFAIQKEAQEEKRSLENAKAQALMQPKVVESERNVEIQKNIAESKVREAESLKAAAVLEASGEAEATKLKASAQAEATKVTANAEATSKVGAAEAEVILAKGKSNAEAYRLEVNAMGRDVFGQIRVMEKISTSNLKLIPENLVLRGGTDSGGLMNGFFGVSLLEKLSGRSFTQASTVSSTSPPQS